MAKILVIEDNPTNLQLMTYLLEAFGHTPMEAVDAETGLELIRHGAPDLILCDIHLPSMDGFGVAQQLKNIPAFRAIPLVAVTALAMVGDRDRILSAGFDGYITKPITPETFIGQVEAFLPPAARSSSMTPQDERP
jgi:CheY-like chemotaxis protein